MPRACSTALALLLFSGASADDSFVRPDAKLTFERDIHPLLKKHCFDCHGATSEIKGGLDLRLRRLMVKGGESGAAIKPGSPDASYLVQRIKNKEMPSGDAKVPADEIALFERWIADGAPTAREEPTELTTGVGITAEERAFWSFQPIKRPSVPKVEDPRLRTPIDVLIADRWTHENAPSPQAKGLSFSPDADARTLIRRAYFDLIGLPPSVADVAAFEQDSIRNPQSAFGNLIDRLLESKHYGERWGRHWLDVAGYADSEGVTNSDAARPWAYKYRDYVIKSFNEDKPFDQFIQEQLAGDELVAPPYTNMSVENIEKLVATGFLRMAADGTGSGSNNAEARNQTMADTIKIVSTSLLGLSVGCAQCHDHRYDPIRQRDYYRLRAIFEPALDWQNWKTPPQRLITLYTDDDRAKAAGIEAEAQKVVKVRNENQAAFITDALEKELTKHPAELRDKLRTAYRTAGDKRTPEQKSLLTKFPSVNISGGNLYQYNQKAADEIKAMDKKIAEIRATKSKEEFIRVLTETPGKIPSTHLFHRGDHRQPKDRIDPGGLTIATAVGQQFDIPGNVDAQPSTGRRLAYAKWLTNGKHPLLARVLVNRIWLHHFGRGIVGTPGDFGVLGQRPTHPELLDWLAAELMGNGWSLKKLHKQIMTSTVYRQFAAADSERLAIDPSNALYWKWSVQRLDAEVVRDRILAASGVLTDKVFGAAVAIKPDDTGQIIVDGDQTRRSIYVTVKRTQPVAMLKAFDAPVMQTNCDCRPATTSSTQSLMLMNSDFIMRHAKKFAQRVVAESEAIEVAEIAIPESLNATWSPWSFACGEIDESGKVVSFTPLPHWTGSQWQGGAKMPDAKYGWTIIHAKGGHPNDKTRMAIRRWTAPRDGVAKINGNVHHGSENGDGVRARVVSGDVVHGQWAVKHRGVDTNVAEINVAKGTMIDLVVDANGTVTSDSFSWPVKITIGDITWDSQTGFHGPPPPSIVKQVALAWQLAYCRPASREEIEGSIAYIADQVATMNMTMKKSADEIRLQAMTNLCQVLLSSNEFLYVD